MIALKDMLSSHRALKDGLRENGQRHKCYNMYTSMNRAMCLLLDGCLYINNGQSWNDLPDRKQMHGNNAYGLCFSCSTIENIAMWMLYSGDHGKNGAMIQFPKSVMLELLECQELEIGNFDEAGFFVPSGSPLRKDKEDYEICLTDVVYTDFLVGNQDTVILSRGEDHVHAPVGLLDGEDVFTKHYAWSYEKECRLIVKPRRVWSASTIKIQLSKSAIRLLKDNVIRSPVFSGKISFGKPSHLLGQVMWDL